MDLTDLTIAPPPETADPIEVLNAPNRIELHGACYLVGGEDLACSTLELRRDGISLLVEAAAEVGDEVTVALPHVGLHKGTVSRLFPSGFEVAISRANPKLVAYLDWLDSGPERKGDERRRFDRVVPLRKLVPLERAGEEPSMARLIDISRCGAAFTSSKPFSEGERVTLGRFSGRVVRVLEGGAAVDFDAIIDEPTFEELIQVGGIEATAAST